MIENMLWGYSVGKCVCSFGVGAIIFAHQMFKVNPEMSKQRNASQEKVQGTTTPTVAIWLKSSQAQSFNMASSDHDSDFLGSEIESQSSDLEVDVEQLCPRCEDDTSRDDALRDVIRTIPIAVQRILEDDSLAVMQSNLRARGRCNYVLTSVFTGFGTDLVAGVWTLDEVREQMLGDTERGVTVVYSITDFGDLQQYAIKEHSHHTKPRHRFRDILTRLFNGDREDIQRILDARLAEFETLKLELRFGGLDKGIYTDEKKKLSSRLLRELLFAFRDIEFREKSYCLECNCECFIHPWSDKSLEGYVWVEYGGNNCIPWSRIGAAAGWLHTATFSCLAWAFSSRFYEPSKVLQECAPGFDQPIFRQIMADAENNGPRSAYSHPPSKVHESHILVFKSSTSIFGPTNVGVGSTRRRLYARYEFEGASDRQSVAMVPSGGFEDFAFTSSFTPGDVFLAATPAVIAGELKERIQLSKSKVSLSAGDAHRLKGWIDYAITKGFMRRIGEEVEFLSDVPMLAINIAQNSYFYKSFGQH